MKTIEEIISFEPQVADAEFGPEPSLRDILWRYYKAADCTYADCDKFTAEYIKHIAKFAGAT